MKIFSIILGILFALTSEAYSYDQNKLGKQLTQSGQENTQKAPERHKRPSKPNNNWLWGNGKPISSSELLYLEADMEAPEVDWYWGDAIPLSEEDIQSIAKKQTFPNWVQEGAPSIILPQEESEEQPDRNNVFLTADHVTHDNKKNRVWAWGKVLIRLDDDRTLLADKVTINNNNGDGKAMGNVTIIQSDGTRLKSNKTLFNINNQQIRLFETRGQLGKNYYIKGKKITRYSQNHFKIQKAHITTCKGSLPDWVFEAESMDVEMGDRAIFTKGILKVRDIPIFYFPIGYIPINQERKSGLLMPAYGSSSLDGVIFDNAYYWAINDHSDATFTLGYQSLRGFTPGIEYRYTPDASTVGSINASYIDDKITGSTFWKLAARHSQNLPFDFQFDGTLDLVSNNFSRNFEDSTATRSRRNTDSYARITKDMDQSSFEILNRYRSSTEQNSDQLFAQLPSITYKVSQYAIGENNFFFNLDTSFTSFRTDLNSATNEDDIFTVQRFDFHPQISHEIKLAPWLSLTPTLGIRETTYSKGLDANNNNKRLNFFTRESFDITAQLFGPRIEKVYEINSKNVPKIKHLLEPRITYNFIPDTDEKDRAKIKVLDGVDSVSRQSLLTYSLTQRFLQKEVKKDDTFSTRNSLRFDISQTFDLIEATGGENPEDKRPLSDIRFDLDSRFLDNLEINVDTTFDPYGDVFKTWNFNIGVKPLDSMFLSLERRFVRKGDVFTIASLDWNIKKGWRLQASTRLDELTNTNRDNQVSLFFDDPCRCWGFNLDIIKRDNFRSGGTGTKEFKLFLGITLRGLGSLTSGKNKILNLHRTFQSIHGPEL
jgi:LPS-assembly protein